MSVETSYLVKRVNILSPCTLVTDEDDSRNRRGWVEVNGVVKISGNVATIC